ncbi:MAG: ABC transporter substrate-binding protein [Armatimonadota bacterium]|nr:ABC transporter substrate-binding protein [Armatimonadota bacterium]
MLKSKTWIALAVALAVTVPALTADTAPQAPSRPSGGTVSFGYIARPRSLDPNIWTGTSDNMVIRQMYDPMVWSPRPGIFVPGLATTWSVSRDGLTYTFTLRQDVKFHDGTPFNAAAVKFMFDRINDPASRSLQRPAIGPFDRAEVINEYTVAIHFKEPFAPFMANLAGSALSPASPAAVQRLRDNFAQAPVGTGPFMFEKWEGNDLHMVRNPDYRWAPNFMNHQGPAYLDRIIWKTIPEATTRMIALQRGEVNAIHFPALDQVADFKKNPNFQVYRKDTPGHPKSMPINIKAAPTDDLRIRQAILYGVDRQKVVDLVQFGNAEVAYGPFTRFTPFYNPVVKKYYAYSKAKAVELLAGC